MVSIVVDRGVRAVYNKRYKIMEYCADAFPLHGFEPQYVRKGRRLTIMKLKRVLAVLGIAVLAGMYLLSLVFAVIDHPLKSSLLSASLYATVVIPVLLYVFLFVTRLLRRNGKDAESRSSPDKRKKGKTTAD